MLTIDTTPRHFTPKNAAEIANEMNADVEDDWNYSVNHIEGNRWARVEVTDENGAHVAFM